MTQGPTVRRVWGGTFAALLIAASAAGCGPKPRGEGGRATAADAADEAPYQAEVDEGVGAAVAILVDTSGSMKERAPGDSRPKYVVAQEALEAMLDATDAFVARRPDFPIKIGIYTFSSSVHRQRAIAPYDKAALRATIEQLPRPGGGTAIGDAMREARPDLYRAGVFRKYLLVVTDGENRNGRPPDEVARAIFRKSEGTVQIYFVAFDTSPQKFAFLKDVGGDVLGAGSAGELRAALDGIYQGKILAEATASGETLKK
jgi:Mg-chelatase subunit ChlD